MKTCLCWWLTLGLGIFLGSANAESFVPSTPEQDEINAFGKLIQPGERISTIQVITMQIFAARYLASGRHEDAMRVCTAISKGNDTEGAHDFATMCLSNSHVMAGRFDEAEAIILGVWRVRLPCTARQEASMRVTLYSWPITTEPEVFSC